LNSGFDVSPSGAFLIALASVLAILNVICSYIKTEVIAPQSVFVVLPLAHPDYRRGRFPIQRFPLRPKKAKTDKKKTNDTCADPAGHGDFGNLYLFDLKAASENGNCQQNCAENE